MQYKIFYIINILQLLVYITLKIIIIYKLNIFSLRKLWFNINVKILYTNYIYKSNFFNFISWDKDISYKIKLSPPLWTKQTYKNQFYLKWISYFTQVKPNTNFIFDLCHGWTWEIPNQCIFIKFGYIGILIIIRNHKRCFKCPPLESDTDQHKQK